MNDRRPLFRELTLSSQVKLTRSAFHHHLHPAVSLFSPSRQGVAVFHCPALLPNLALDVSSITPSRPTLGWLRPSCSLPGSAQRPPSPSRPSHLVARLSPFPRPRSGGLALPSYPAFSFVSTLLRTIAAPPPSRRDAAASSTSFRSQPQTRASDNQQHRESNRAELGR